MNLKTLRPKAYYLGDIYDDSATAKEIIIVDGGPEWTGLYDTDENPIYRPQEKIKFGFH